MRTTIGFDFDMTLVDTSNSLFETLKVVFPRECKLQIEQSKFQLNGLPLDQILLHYCHQKDLSKFKKEFMAAYQTVGIKNANLIPGAVESLEIVHQMGFDPVIISAKSGENLTKLIKIFNLPIKKIHSEKHGQEKTKTMISEKTILYIGDQESDVSAAHSVPIPALRLMGDAESSGTVADWQLNDISMFPRWFQWWVDGACFRKDV